MRIYVETVLKRGKECKGSIRFETDAPHDRNTPITNVYVSKDLAGVSTAKAVKITVEVIAP